MAGNSLRYYLALPPGVVIRKIEERTRRATKRLRVKIRGDLSASDREFRLAVKPGFSFYRRDLEQEPRFFFDPRNRKELVERARKLFPRSERAIFASAEDIMAHRFDLLGSGKKNLGKEIDWHRDFKSGYRWEPVFYGDVPIIDLSRQGVDVKVPWELSRFQHLPTLGKAYWFGLEGSERRNAERYAREFASEIKDWIQKNPVGIGVNWTCTMDVAIRAVNWLWGYYFFCGSPALTEDFHTAFFRALLDHARHIIDNLEFSDSLTGNHYLADIVGLIFIGALVPEFRESDEWRDLGARELEKEMQKQVYRDGMDFEASIPYHRLALELFATGFLLLKLNGIELSELFRQRLEKMFESVLFYTRPDGLAPQIGDADDGRLQILSDYNRWDRRNHRCLLALGGCLFRRKDMKAAGRGFEEEVFYLLNGDVRGANGTVGSLESHGFPDSGLYVMRSRDMFLISDCGSNGQNGRGGHGHNDTLSLEIAVEEPFIVDPGAYIYTASEKWRNSFRSTSFHNTILVNGEEMNRIIPGEVFSLSNDAIPRVFRWENTAQCDFLDAEHNGYSRLSPPVFHRRQIYFDKTEGFWTIRDMLHHGEKDNRFSPSSLNCEQFFHFDPRISIRRVKPPLSPQRIRKMVRKMTDFTGGAVPRLAQGPAVKAQGRIRTLILIPLLFRGLKMSIDEGWVSPRYGIKRRNSVLKFQSKGNCPKEFLTLIVAWPGTKA